LVDIIPGSKSISLERGDIISCGLLISVILLIYFQTYDFGFVLLDDYYYVVENPHVTRGLSLNGIIWAFTSFFAGYTPITFISHMLDVSLFGLKPGLHHLSNYIIHILNTLLLYIFLKYTTNRTTSSFLVSALFACHPLHVESVAWISERKDVLSGLFFFIGLLSYSYYVKVRSVFVYILTLALFVLGLMAKPSLVTLPFVLLLLDYWPLKRFASQTGPLTNTRNIFLEKIPFLIIALFFSVITLYIHVSSGAVASVNELGIESRLSNAITSYAIYLYSTFVPLGLACYYPFETKNSLIVVLSLVVLTGITFLAVKYRRQQSHFFTGWFWFLLTLAPVIGIVQAGTQGMADRYTYLPLIGVFILIVFFFDDYLEHLEITKKLLFLTPVILALGFIAWVQVGFWKNDLLLFTRALAVTDNNSMAHSNLAEYYETQGDRKKALLHAYTALSISPSLTQAHLTIGNVMLAENKFNEALKHFDITTKINPKFAKGYTNSGIALFNLGRHQEALEKFDKAIELDPMLSDARFNKALALERLGFKKMAMREYRFVLTLRPHDNEARAAYTRLKNRLTTRKPDL